MKNFLLDIQRTLLFLRVVLKLGAGPLFRSLMRLPPNGLSYGARIRIGMEELGLTYLKLGQYLAMRFDILPSEIYNELNKLFENVPPFPFAEARSVIERELGGALEDLFLSFEEEPIAAASVAQVHKARTHANECVAVKVQRPGVDLVFAADMRNLRRTATLLDALHVGGTISLRDLAEEFAAWTLREMDFVIEGRTADRLHEKALSFEIVPKIYWEYTTSKVLTMEFLSGMTLNQALALLDEGGMDLLRSRLPTLNLELAFHRLAQAILHQLFVNGFFHADPHPGNVMVYDDNTVAFIDFGIFGELNEGQREMLIGMIENIAVGNIAESFRYYVKQMTPTDETDLRGCYRQGNVVLSRWYQASRNPSASIQERHLGGYSAAMFDLIRNYHLKPGVDTLLFWRALNALDATALRFSKYLSLDLLSEMRRFFEKRSPSPIERVLKLVAQPGRITAQASTIQSVLEQLEPLQRDLVAGRFDGTISVHESQVARSVSHKEARWLAASLVAGSLVILARSTYINDWLRLLTGGLAGILFVLLILNVSRG